ncbi:MAG: family 2A encapsulin nanocompartment cargo protein cysteine desulfurase [Methylotenera sp.]|nr:family 2A encapsulin nanocompartment cargo protein cysteine desulfurase [Methylotenera sp.]MDO9233149.1 family 2A encapsulin nanocompartment cargo protein cysteine desulfurase [Methylotenera sp.]MDP2402334.1 family 2A encapsulin nanocompartment cargo protein cysteine desulfurase [Methylotenera sp.]MDP3095713.1 family 2A encapsulin nanocompartment cargo protein cysteine desulfurase [Methylotenera sp.]MDZ4222738.1 family 2A encapsulin nanocompartment cargo protein cysteine desulfurase [Methylo
MTINNAFSGLGDFSSFEPEAILAALPGDHPRMAAALAVGRQASAGGHLDVSELTRIANELYSEGFPAGSPFAQQEVFPSNASLSPVPSRGVLPSPNLVSDPVQKPTPSIASAMPSMASGAPNLVPTDILNTGYANSLPSSDYLDISHLINGAEDPYQTELNQLLGGLNSHSGIISSGSSQTASLNGATPYYFLQDSPHQQDAAQTSPISSAHPPFDANLVRKDFPILRELVNGRPLIWFDNAATTQKPQMVIDRIAYFYAHENSNIHRAAHELAARATDAYEDARETVRRFINAPSIDNIIFVRGTTEAINLVAKTWGKKHIGAGDEILISHLEHHANIVPWQQLCQETGATLKVAPVDESGQIILSEYQKLLTSHVKLVSFTQVSNALGTVTPASEMIQMAHRAGAKVLLDGAQSVSHMRTDVQSLDADFFVFSGHKVFGPTGIGALYGKPEFLADMPAWQGGGNMIKDVTFDKTVYHDAPLKFEAGTGNIADAVGLGAALVYVERIGIDNIARYEHDLLEYATAAMCKVPGLCLVGTAKEKASVLSFTLNGYKSEEVGAALNQEGIAVRSGHHCAQPILRRFGLETTVRPSLAFYNTPAEVDVMVNALLRLASHKAP